VISLICYAHCQKDKRKLQGPQTSKAIHYSSQLMPTEIHNPLHMPSSSSCCTQSLILNHQQATVIGPLLATLAATANVLWQNFQSPELE